LIILTSPPNFHLLLSSRPSHWFPPSKTTSSCKTVDKPEENALGYMCSQKCCFLKLKLNKKLWFKSFPNRRYVTHTQEYTAFCIAKALNVVTIEEQTTDGIVLKILSSSVYSQEFNTQGRNLPKRWTLGPFG
jgi:hypothetical protein